MPVIGTKGAASAQGFGLTLGAEEPNYIEDVFSTWLYTGNGTTQTITNGIDLAGEGGLVWQKGRTNNPSTGQSGNHYLFDTIRGVNQAISTNTTDLSYTRASSVTAFNSNGFSVGNNGYSNGLNQTYASWTFRKQPKFFDVVTWTGNGIQPRTISHSLGSVPGCVIGKRTSSTSDWVVYHRSLNGGTNPDQYQVLLNTTAAQSGPGSFLLAAAPTSTEISVAGAFNSIGVTYVAYLFAHDAGGFGESGTDNVISCGSFTMSGGQASVNLGWEPQWLLVKRTDSTSNWFIEDNMRGMPVTGEGGQLYANTSGADVSQNNAVPDATGFTWSVGTGTYIYIAIRRGPMKTPTTGTSVFAPLVRTGTASSTTVTGFGFPLDLVASLFRSSSQDVWFDRLRGPLRQLATTTTAAETTQSASINGFDLMDGYRVGIDNVTNMTNGNTTTSGYLNYGFRRAPGFFDEVCYTGTGVARTVAHNLGAVPELMIVKNRSSAASWLVYSAATGSSWYLVLNLTREKFEDAAVWNNTTPTAGVFSLGNAWVEANQSGQTYVAYLFASCPGVSKAGGYTGTGTTQTINCGFTTGARFVLIKRTDVDGFAWYVWDSARGIVAGNDPYLRLNSTAAEVTSNDTIDTDSTGFVVNQVAATNVNVNAATYIFLAIA